MAKYKLTVILNNGKKIRSTARFSDDDRNLIKSAVKSDSSLTSISFNMGLWRGKMYVKTTDISAIRMKPWLF